MRSSIIILVNHVVVLGEPISVASTSQVLVLRPLFVIDILFLYIYGLFLDDKKD